MARRDKEWARQQRNILHFLLGNKCVDCGTTEKLTLDCDEPQGDHHHKLGWDCRMRFYWKQYYKGNLKLRCLVHNAMKGGTTDKAFHYARRSTHTHTHTES